MEVVVPSAQPVLVCLQSLLFKLQPGLTLSNKPPATAAACAPRPAASALRATAALAVAVPAAAVAVYAAHSRGVPLPWSQPATVAVSATQASEPLSQPSTEQRRERGGAAPQRQVEAPMQQQVAFAKDVMMQLRGAVWHGLRRHDASGRGDAFPAVFHVTVAEGAQLLGTTRGTVLA